MAKKDCPHCGNVVSKETAHCGCGYEFTGAEPLGAGVARETSARLLHDKPPEKSRKRKEGRKKGSASRSSGQVQPAAVESPAPSVNKVEAAKPEVSMSSSSKLMECPSCPAHISKRAERCPKCGNSPYAKCQICSNQITANSTSCPECGDPDPFSG